MPKKLGLTNPQRLSEQGAVPGRVEEQMYAIVFTVKTCHVTESMELPYRLYLVNNTVLYYLPCVPERLYVTPITDKLCSMLPPISQAATSTPGLRLMLGFYI